MQLGLRVVGVQLTQAGTQAATRVHLIDPATGRSPQHVHSVTILADDGLTSEALSKMVFVLGVQRGLALVDGLPGVDAVVVDAQGRLHASGGLLHGLPAARQ